MDMEWTDSERKDRVIVALDCTGDEAIAIGEQLAGHARWVKVGMTLYYAAGPAIVRQLHKLGFKVFVDLKLHDIPHQVHGAAKSLAEAGADLFTVHATGGADMLRAAAEGACAGAGGGRPPAVCAITVLTSMDAAALSSIGVPDDPAAQVGRLAALARDAQLSGVVCSPMEAAAMRGLLGEDALVVTPGVRPHGAALGDQSRVATPKDAFDAGASHIVVGRPVTRADNSLSAFEEITCCL